MNVQLPKEYKVRKRDIVIYTICIIICVVALTIVVTMQVLGEGITNKVFHTNKLQIASEEEQLKLRTDFENMFTNKIVCKMDWQKGEGFSWNEFVICFCNRAFRSKR